jgi:hypothetical protein
LSVGDSRLLNQQNHEAYKYRDRDPHHTRPPCLCGCSLRESLRCSGTIAQKSAVGPPRALLPAPFLHPVVPHFDLEPLEDWLNALTIHQQDL